ncbi:MAG: hypothetical protein Q9219_006603 [cf. Caloplaca sp. 3 TL-2023]
MSTSRSLPHRRRASLTARQTTDKNALYLVLSPDAQWDKLLNAAPKALVCLGQAFVASTSGAVRPIQVEKIGPLEYLDDSTQSSCEAFREAEAKMTKLYKVASYIDKDGIGKVLRLCEDQSLARADLPRQIERLKRLSLDCVENTAGIQQKVEAWAHFAQVLKRACTTSQGSPSLCPHHEKRKQLTHATDTAKKASGTLKDKTFSQQNASENQERKLEEAKKSLIDHQRRLGASERRMDKAQRDIPKGGKAVGIRAADGIMNTLSATAEGLGKAMSAVTDVVAAGGPTLTLKLSSEKIPASQSKSTQLAQAAAAKAATKHKKDTARQAREDFEKLRRDFLDCEKLYLELEKQDREAKDQFNDIQLQLQRLGQEQISVEKTEEILSRCIGNLIEFQDHISHIQRFFAQVHEHISVIDTTYLTDFVESADKLAQLPSSSSEQEAYQRKQQYYLEEIRDDAEKLRKSYIAAGELASTYVHVSEKYIFPGVTEVNRLMIKGSQNNKMDVNDKVKVINGYARKAMSEVSKIAAERRENVRDMLWDTKRPLEDLGEAIEQCGDIGEEDEDEDEDEGQGEGGEEGEEEENGDEEQTAEDEDEDAVAGDQEEEEEDEWDDM